MLETIFKTLAFDSDEVNTYLLLLKTGPTAAGNLAKTLGVPRSSVYGFLKRLADHGLVTESQKHGIKTFYAESPEKVNLLFGQKIAGLQQAQTDFVKLLPELKNQQGQKYQNPKLQLFEGSEQLKLALKDMLLYYDLETFAFWPQKKMVEVLGGDFFRYHNKQRIHNRLSVKALWPKNQLVEIKTHPYFGSGKNFLREIRIAPESVDFHMGYWIYGNKTVFISSRQENFGFILDSQEMADMLKSQFEILWNLSKPLPANPADSQSFLLEL